MPGFVDRYSFIMLEYEKVSSDCLLCGIIGTQYLVGGDYARGSDSRFGGSM